MDAFEAYLGCWWCVLSSLSNISNSRRTPFWQRGHYSGTWPSPGTKHQGSSSIPDTPVMQPSYPASAPCGCSQANSEVRILPNNWSSNIWEEEEGPDNGHTSQGLAHNDIIRQHRKQGYIDGLTSHREEQLQRGFDVAYPQGAELAIQIGQILARAKTTAHRIQDDSVYQEAKSELQISKVLDKKYFDQDLNLKGETHPLIDKYSCKKRKTDSST